MPTLPAVDAPDHGAAVSSARHRSRGALLSMQTLATHPAIPWLLAVLMTVAGGMAIHASLFLNNEGVLTWIFTGLIGESTRDMLFFMKIRPPISLLYSPFATAGLTPFLWVHLIVAALAVPMTASLGRRLGLLRPNLAAALLALSPLFFAGAAAGVQNTDGLVGVLAVAWLLAHRRPLAAGLLMGVVVFGRVETALFAVAFAAYALWTPGARRVLLGLPVVPVLFVAAGALYHGTLLWLLHWPSSALDNPAVSASERALYGGNINDMFTTLIALTPVIGALAWASWRSMRSLEGVLTLAAVAFVVAIRVLPVTQLVYVSASPRNVLPAVPLLCLALARTTETWGRSRWQTIGAAVLVLGCALLALPRLEAWVAVLVLIAAGSCTACALIALRSTRAAAAALLAAAAGIAALTALAPDRLPLLSRTRLFLGEARDLDACTRWIGSTVPPGSVVVTDQHLLHIWMDRYAPAVHVDMRHVVQPDMVNEAHALTDPATPQFAKLFGSRRFNYAPFIFPEEITRLPGDVYFVMRVDSEHRAHALTDPPFDRVEWLITEESWMGGRLRADRTRRPAEAPG